MIEKQYDVTGVHTTSMWIDASLPLGFALTQTRAVLASLKEVPAQQDGQIEDDAKVRGSVIVWRKLDNTVWVLCARPGRHRKRR